MNIQMFHFEITTTVVANFGEYCTESQLYYFKSSNFLFQRVIQQTALEDSNVPNKEQWDDAIKFMEDTIALENEKSEQMLSDIVGPGWQERWLYWTSRSKDQVHDKHYQFQVLI